MIAFLTGLLRGRTPGSALLDVGGVGYRVLMSTASLGSLPPDGHEVTVHTHLHVREDEMTLYGFGSEAERTFFERLIAVSGIGPKVALAVLSALRPDALAQAIVSEDVALLSSVPGVGKKTAQRLILELRDKLDAVAGPATSPASAAVPEARDALLAMGFTAAEAAAALRDAPADADAATLLKGALRTLGGRP